MVSQGVGLHLKMVTGLPEEGVALEEMGGGGVLLYQVISSKSFKLIVFKTTLKLSINFTDNL